jgi:hypothetical protein
VYWIYFHGSPFQFSQYFDSPVYEHDATVLSQAIVQLLPSGCNKIRLSTYIRTYLHSSLVKTIGFDKTVKTEIILPSKIEDTGNVVPLFGGSND